MSFSSRLLNLSRGLWEPLIYSRLARNTEAWDLRLACEVGAVSWGGALALWGLPAAGRQCRGLASGGHRSPQVWGQCSGGWEGRRNPKAVVPGLTKGCSGCSAQSLKSLWVTCHSSGLSAEPAAEAAGRRGFSQEQAAGTWKNGLIPSGQPVPTPTAALQGATLPSAAGRRQRKNGDTEWASPGVSVLPEDTVCLMASGSFLPLFPEGPLGTLFFTSFSSLLSSYCVLTCVLRVCREVSVTQLIHAAETCHGPQGSRHL